jgi:DHA3 family macrolide efflux protein-like MFS transporter
MLASDLVSAVALFAFGLSIVAFGKPPVAALLIVPFLLSSVRVFFMPAKSAALPALVPANALMSANALSMTTQNLMPMISLGLTAGVLSILYKLSPALFYTSTVGLNAISFLGSALFIARLPAVLPDRSALALSKTVEEPNAWADLKEGLRYLRGRHDLLVMTALLAVFRLSVAPFFVVYLAANDRWFGGKPETVAWFEFSFFVGMVAASSYAGRLKPKHPARTFCVGLAVVGVTVAAMGFSPNFWLFVLWNVIAGLAIPIADVPITSYVQLTVPDAFRGRVNAVRDMIATGVMPIGMGLAGVLVARTSLLAAFLTMGVGMTLACLYGLLDPRFRDVEMPETETKAPDLEDREPVASRRSRRGKRRGILL